MNPATSNRLTRGLLFLTVFLDLLGFGMVLPLMPLYASDARFRATPAEVGALMAIFSAMQFLFAPFWGRLSDRVGRKPVLLIGLFGSSISYLLYGLAASLPMLFLARGLAGFMGANIAVAQAAMADLSPPEERARAMGFIGAAFGLGFILGPLFGGVLAPLGLAAAPLAAALVTLLNGLGTLFWLPESKAATATPSGRSHPLSRQTWRDAARFPGALAVCFCTGLFTTFFAAFEVVLPLWGSRHEGWDMTTTGWVFTFVGMVVVIVQGGLMRPLVRRLGEKGLVRAGLFLVGTGLLLLGTWSQGWGSVLFALGLVACGAGLVNPGLSSLASLNADAASQGLILGLFQSMGALGRMTGPVVGGEGFESWQGTLFTATAVGMAGLLGLFLLLERKMRTAKETPA
ncbi:MAG: MFS transporter [Magnetococcales bacterium]|nr:MFS transporter [Magnetococcales bacterium]